MPLPKLHKICIEILMVKNIHTLALSSEQNNRNSEILGNAKDLADLSEPLTTHQ